MEQFNINKGVTLKPGLDVLPRQLLMMNIAH